MAAKKKMIVIPHNGPIYVKGGIMGPITTPFNDEVKTIGLLLMRGVPVSEVLENGELLPLTVSNFDKDNNVVVEVKETKEEEAARLEAEEAVRLELLEAEEKATAAAKEAAKEEKAEAKEAKEAEEKAEAAEAKKQQNQQKNKQERNDQKQRQTADDVTKK